MIREIKYNEVFDSQKIFRKIMDSMARPGKINNLDDLDINPPSGLNKSSALIGFALLNSDVTFFTLNNQDEVNEYIKINTSSVPVSKVENAGYIFIKGNASGEIIRNARKGELEYPEDGATIIIDVEKIVKAPVDKTFELILKGPGVKSEETVYIKGITYEILEEVKLANNEYPLGVDIILSDSDANILCIPRTNNFFWN